MSNPIDGDPEVALAILVTFKYGASFGTIKRYTTSLNAIVIGDQTFLPEPSIEVTINERSGGTSDSPFKVRMRTREPLDALTSQRSHSPIRIEVEEVDPTDSSTRRMISSGMLQVSKLNPGTVEIDVVGWKHSLEVPANAWLATSTCNNVLGDKICQVNLAAFQEEATIDAIDGTTISVSGLTTTAVDGYWRFGYAEFEGLRIRIREYATGSDLVLMKIPPPSWAGQTITLTPGCDRRLDTCRNKYDNEAKFTGFGLKIPAYNPYLESV